MHFKGEKQKFILFLSVKPIVNSPETNGLLVQPSKRSYIQTGFL